MGHTRRVSGQRRRPDAARRYPPGRGARLPAAGRSCSPPQSVVWPSDGVAILPEHHGAVETRAVPTREPDGTIRIAARAMPAIFAAVQAGRRSMSVEFTALDEIRTAGGVREIRRAMVSAAALTDRPEYSQTRAEVRERPEVRVWL